MRRLFSLLPSWPLLPFALVGCPAPTTGLAQAQQSAQDFNLDARFGRNEMIMEQIAPAERDEYQLHHRQWGTRVHIADIEIAGMKKQDDKHVDVVVRVSWYLPEQQELRNTTLKQGWHAKTTGWELLTETRLDGDYGLLGESVIVAEPPAPSGPAQFPTVRLGSAQPVQD
ncbi:MAG TPA: hypothetical protein VIF09_17360 [Polyangiaceae bacterium]|jgi:hypothetical protein